MPDKRKNPDRPIVGVGAVIMRGDDIVLIQRGRPPKQGEWSLPGGAVHLGETTRDAIVREIHEETGLTVTIDHILDVVDYIETTPRGQTQFHYVLIDYLAFHKEGALVAGTDAADARFVSFEDALSMVTWTETRRIIRLAYTAVHKVKGQEKI